MEVDHMCREERQQYTWHCFLLFWRSCAAMGDVAQRRCQFSSGIHVQRWVTVPNAGITLNDAAAGKVHLLPRTSSERAFTLLSSSKETSDIYQNRQPTTTRCDTYREASHTIYASV